MLRIPTSGLIDNTELFKAMLMVYCAEVIWKEWYRHCYLVIHRSYTAKFKAYLCSMGYMTMLGLRLAPSDPLEFCLIHSNSVCKCSSLKLARYSDCFCVLQCYYLSAPKPLTWDVHDETSERYRLSHSRTSQIKAVIRYGLRPRLQTNSYSALFCWTILQDALVSKHISWRTLQLLNSFWTLPFERHWYFAGTSVTSGINRAPDLKSQISRTYLELISNLSNLS